MMVFQARLYLAICEKFDIWVWIQCLVISIPCLLPSVVWEAQGFLWDFCEKDPIATYTGQFLFSWVFPRQKIGCPVVWRYSVWYLAFYVISFHCIRDVVAFVVRKAPAGKTWAAAAFSGSMMIGGVLRR